MPNNFTTSEATSFSGIVPLFVATRNLLLERLRLKGASSTAAQAIVDEAIESVRVDLYSKLSKAIVDEILAITYVPNPTTTDGIRRARANRLETLMVKVYLLRRMPVLFIDTTDKDDEIWNEEGLTRHLSPEAIEAAVNALQTTIDLDLGVVLGTEDSNEVQIATLEPETTFVPGDTIRNTPLGETND